MNEPNLQFGPKVTCIRPPHMAFNAQIINLDSGLTNVSLEFGDIADNRPDWSKKQSIRLRKGEIAMLFAVCSGKLGACGFGFRASKLGVQAKRNDEKLWLGCYQDRDIQKYIELTQAERYELFDLCLQVLRGDNQGTLDVVAQLDLFFSMEKKKKCEPTIDSN